MLSRELPQASILRTPFIHSVHHIVTKLECCLPSMGSDQAAFVSVLCMVQTKGASTHFVG